MQKLFDALSEKYNSAEVRDVKFVVNPNAVDNQDVDALDAALANVVREATPLAGPEALG